MILICKLGKHLVFDLKGHGKKVKAVCLNHCQLDYGLYRTSFLLRELLLEPGVIISMELLNDKNKNVHVIRSGQASGGSLTAFKKTGKEARLNQHIIQL